MVRTLSQDLVRKLSKRPVVAQFRRRSAALGGADGASASAAKAAALISSVGSSLLSKARGEDGGRGSKGRRAEG